MTYKTPGDKYWNQIDYILTNSSRSKFDDWKTKPSADCEYDYLLLMATFKLKLCINKSNDVINNKTVINSHKFRTTVINTTATRNWRC